MRKKDAAYPVEYFKIGMGQYLLRFGGWKIWRPVAECPFPAIAIGIGRWDVDGALFATTLTQWLLNLQKYTANGHYRFKLALGGLNTVTLTVEFDE